MPPDHNRVFPSTSHFHVHLPEQVMLAEKEWEHNVSIPFQIQPETQGAQSCCEWPAGLFLQSGQRQAKHRTEASGRPEPVFTQCNGQREQPVCHSPPPPRVSWQTLPLCLSLFIYFTLLPPFFWPFPPLWPPSISFLYESGGVSGPGRNRVPEKPERAGGSLSHLFYAPLHYPQPRRQGIKFVSWTCTLWQVKLEVSQSFTEAAAFVGWRTISCRWRSQTSVHLLSAAYLSLG